MSDENKDAGSQLVAQQVVQDLHLSLYHCRLHDEVNGVVVQQEQDLVESSL